MLITYLKNHRRAIMAGLLLTLLVLLLQAFGAQNSVALQRINGLIYDLRLKTMLQPRATDVNIIILDIDEKSLAAEGRFPWSRKKIARIIEKLADAGAVVVAFDIMFSEPERNPVDSVIRLLQQQPLQQQQLIARLSEHIGAADADQIMADSLQLTDVVLGMAFQDDADVRVGELPPSVIRFDTLDTKHLHSHHFDGYTGNLSILQQRAPGIGFINSTPDPDNFIRTTSLIAEHNGRFYPSLALEAAKLYTLADDIRVSTADLGQSRSITGIQLGRKVIPTDEYGRILIPFKGGAKSYPYVSVTDLLHDHIDPAQFENAIVFVGTSAIGHADLRATPVGVQYPGVEIHANVLDGLLHPHYIPSVPDWITAGILALLLFTGILLSLILPTLGPLAIFGCGIGLVAGLIGLDFYTWSIGKVSLPMATSLLLALLLSVGNIAMGYFREAGKRKQIKSIFDQYVPPAHIDKMLQDPKAITLSGERKEMTVLFSDIRSFTTISEKLSASVLANLLNRYFSPITQAIFEHQGTIDKYVGDMVMAFWNAPLNDPHHAQNAVYCAFDMLTITTELSEIFQQQNLPEIKVGIGINSGEMNVGDMGSVYRRAYTVLGDAVNLGARLEGLTKFYGVEILVGQGTARKCPDLSFRLIDKVRVKGKHQAVSIFEPLSPSEAAKAPVLTELQAYHSACDSYLNQHWADAEEKFSTLLRNNPQRKVYSIYHDRTKNLKHQSLPDDWDGSFTHTSK